MSVSGGISATMTSLTSPFFSSSGTGVAGQELKLEAAAQDALRHAVAKADPKKTPDGTVTRIVREVLRGLLPLK